MVNLSSIKLSNSRVDETSIPRVAVFVGGTDGIGKLALAGLARLGLSFKAYVIGRKEKETSFRSVIEELHQVNPVASVIWIEGEVSLLSEVKRVCDYIRTLETEVDLLFMTPGFAPFAGRQSTLSPSGSILSQANARKIPPKVSMSATL
jgi:NAD(P)-dependent dehydrogenase (short-subunit alcohol dehydrogenase family)